MKKNLFIISITLLLSGCVRCVSTTSLPAKEKTKIPDNSSAIFLIPKIPNILDQIYEALIQNIMNDGYLIENEIKERYSAFSAGKGVMVRPIMINEVRGLAINGFSGLIEKEYNKYYDNFNPCINDPFLDLVQLTMNFDTTKVTRSYTRNKKVEFEKIKGFRK